MSAKTVLIADDDSAIRTVLSQALTRAGYIVRSTATAAALWRWVTEGQGDAVVTDVVLPDENAFDVIPRIKKLRPTLPIIVMSAKNTIMTAITAAERGAYDYLPKPFDLNALVQTVGRALEQSQRPANAIAGQQGESLPIVGRSPAMQEIYRIIARLTQTDLTVMIVGESGTGKELVARALHDYGRRRKGPFVAVNMAAIPRELIESELFGHEKGAFTGATARHIGKFQEADGGTLFLDEVAELPLDLQVKLLRAIQEGEIDPVGARRPVKVNIRLISATNRNMIEMVKAGQFREDLYYRLNVFPVMVPPLRDRKEDIPELVMHFITRFAAEEGRKVRGIAPEALALLRSYTWPGNVRQLENTVFRAMVLCEGDRLDIQDFPQIASLVEGYEIKIPPAPQLAPKPALPQGMAAIAGGAPMPRRGGPAVADGIAYGIPVVTEGGHIRKLEDVEADMIRLALTRYQGQMSEVARKLGIGRSTLYRRMKDLGLEEAAG